MSKRLRFILILFVCFASWQGLQADNVVTLSNVSGTPDAEVTISVSLTNTDEVSALQLAIPLNDNISLVENSAAVASRASDHSATVGVKNGNIQLFVYSATMKTFSGTSGKVASFKVRLGKEPVTIPIVPSKVILTDANGNTLGCNTLQGSVTILTPKAEYSTRTVDFGRQPILQQYEQEVTVYNVGNQPLEVTALNFSTDEFSCTEPLPFTIQRGDSKCLTINYDPTKRGSVSEELKIVCNSSSKLNTIKLQATPYAVNELHVMGTSGVSDEEVSIHLHMNNMDAITGFQFEFDLPEQIKYVDGSFSLSSRKQDHQVLATLSGKKLKALCYSLTEKDFTGNDGEIASFKVMLDGQYGTTLTPTKVQLTANVDGKNIDVCSDIYGGYIEIRSPQINGNEELSLGNEPVTAVPTQAYYIYNYGNAPLIVSRIVMDNDEFESDYDTLPTTIAPYESMEIKITYKNKVAGEYKAMMQIYSNDPGCRMKNVQLSGSLYSPNFINLSSGTFTPTHPAVIDITLSNHQKISGMQFDVSYPNDKYSFTAEDVVLEEKMNGFLVSSREIENKQRRVFIYSLTDKVVEVDTAQVMTINLLPKVSFVPEGQYDVFISNIILGNEYLQNVQSAPTAQISFTIQKLIGDVNNDGKISIVDIVTLIDILTKPHPEENVSADINEDGYVNTDDIQALSDILLENTK